LDGISRKNADFAEKRPFCVRIGERWLRYDYLCIRAAVSACNVTYSL